MILLRAALFDDGLVVFTARALMKILACDVKGQIQRCLGLSLENEGDYLPLFLSAHIDLIEEVPCEEQQAKVHANRIAGQGGHAAAWACYDMCNQERSASGTACEEPKQCFPCEILRGPPTKAASKLQPKVKTMSATDTADTEMRTLSVRGRRR